MFYIITMVVIVAAIYFITYSIFRDDESSTALAGMVLMVLLAVPFFNNFIGWYDEYVDIEKYKIVSLELMTNTNQETKGVFVLGCGTINSSANREMKYVYVSDEEYGKQIQTLEIRNTYLKETDEETPKLIERTKVVKRKNNIIDYLWNNKQEESVMLTSIERNILVVPKNTIKVNYNIEF